MVTNKKLVLFFVCLSTCLLYFNRQESQKSIKSLESTSISNLELKDIASKSYQDTNAITFITNDMDLIKDSIVEFKVMVEGGIKGEEIIVTSSNTAIADVNTAKLTNNPIQNGDTVRVMLKDFGRAVFTATVKKSPHLKASFPVYIENSDFSYFDTIYNAQIVPDSAILSLDPMHTRTLDETDENKLDPRYLKTSHRFQLKNRHLASDYSLWDWDVKAPKGSAAGIVNINERFTTNDTVVDINFMFGGKYTIYVKQVSNGSIVDSLNFYVNLDKRLYGHPGTGYLYNILDERDGEIYTMDTVQTYQDGAWHRYAVLTEDLKYIPFVMPLIGDPSYTQYIHVSGNAYSHSVKWVKENLKIKDSTVYSTQALFEPIKDKQANPYTSPAPLTSSEINNMAKLKTKRSLCPKGFYIPTLAQFKHILNLPISTTGSTNNSIIEANPYSIKLNLLTSDINIFSSVVYNFYTPSAIRYINGSDTDKKIYWMSSTISDRIEGVFKGSGIVKWDTQFTDYHRAAGAVRCIRKLN